MAEKKVVRLRSPQVTPKNKKAAAPKAVESKAAPKTAAKLPSGIPANLPKGGLLIVESPAKEKTISGILGKGFVVKSCWGHVRDLPKRELGINIENGFEPRYVAVTTKAKIIKGLKDLAKKSQHIYLATDFDREGEAIAWHLLELMDPEPSKVSRITFHEITPRAIEEAIRNPRKIDMELVHAQQTRRIIDRLVGYTLSPLLWEKLQKGLSAGRVQSVALGFVVDRDNEIAAFKPQEYWSLHARLAGTDAKVPFLALLVKKGDRKIEKLDLNKKEDVDGILKELEGKSFSVADIEEKETSRSSAPPFTTASLQQASYRAFGFSPARTMRFAQSLYEGKTLPEGTTGLITYMRTDSVTIAPEARAQAAEYIKAAHGEKYLGVEKKYKTKAKFSQEAHEAIRPTSVLRTPQDMAQYLEPEEAKLYELIWVRFVQSQMADQKLAVTTVSAASGDATFRASGSVVIFDGYKKINIRSANAAEEGAPETGGQVLPPLKIGQKLNLVEFVPAQHFTEPPPRYNAASLVKAMEAHGVGRPSTYAPTIQTLINRNYVIQDKKILLSTELGKKVYTSLHKHFASIVDINFTAQMEENLDQIAHSKADVQAILKDFWTIFEKDLELAKKNMPVEKIGPKETGDICEECKSPMLLRESRFGRYLSCKRFPECKFKIGLMPNGEHKVVKKTDIPCEKCGTLLVERTGKRGAFLACPKFPKCRFTKTLPKPEGQEVPPSGTTAPNP